MVEEMRGHFSEGLRIWSIAWQLTDSAYPDEHLPPSSVEFPLYLALRTLQGYPVPQALWASAHLPSLRGACLYCFGLTGLARQRWSDAESAANELGKLADTMTGGATLADTLTREVDRPNLYASASQLRAWSTWLRSPTLRTLDRFEATTDSLRPSDALVETADYVLGIAFLTEGDLDRSERHLQLLQRWSRDVWVVPREYYLGRIAEGRGQLAEAREHYARFVRWWQDCDPELKPMWEDGRKRLASVSGETRAP